jgi:hypothetical protein
MNFAAPEALLTVTEESGMYLVLDKEDMSCRQCCGSVTFWYGSGYGDLYL